MTKMLTREQIAYTRNAAECYCPPPPLRTVELCEMALALLDIAELVPGEGDVVARTRAMRRYVDGMQLHDDEQRQQLRRAEAERDRLDGLIGELRIEHAAVKKSRDEALDWVRRMHNESQILTCAFCGQAYPPGTPSANDAALREHVMVCEKHPLRTEAERLRAEADEARVDQVAAELREAALRAKGDALAEAAIRSRRAIPNLEAESDDVDWLAALDAAVSEWRRL